MIWLLSVTLIGQEASGCSSAEEGNDIYLKTIDQCCCRETVLGWFH